MADGSDPSAAVSASAGGDPFPGGLPPPAPRETDAPYRPISLLAGTGFAVAVLYGLMIGLGVLFGFFQRSPWLLPLWTFLLPVLGVILSWMARIRIQNSENTLSGTALTSWGIGLSLSFGVVYAAYVAATAMAVRQQADAFAQKWLEEVRKAPVEKAFWYTLRPAERGSGRGNLRGTLEVRFNTPPDPYAIGALSAFSRADYVRLLRDAGDKAEINLAGVTGWDFERGGYSVGLTYQIKTPIASFTLHITVHGSDSSDPETRGRQWYVMIDRTGTIDPSGSNLLLNMSPEGQATLTESSEAQALARRFTTLLTTSGSEATTTDRASRMAALDEAFQLTLSPEQAKRWVKVRGPSLALGQLLGLPYDPESRDLGQKWRAFVEGDLVQAPPDLFWAVEDKRQDYIREVKRLFTGRLGRTFNFDYRPHIAIFQREGNLLRIKIDANLLFLRAMPTGETRPSMMLECLVVVSRDSSQPTRPWRVEGIELIRGRTPPATPGGRG